MSGHAMLCKPSRQKISTQLKFLVSMNAVPAKFEERLHPSQISRYRNHFNLKQYLGHELIEAGDDLLNMIRQLNQYSFERKMLRGLMRLSVNLRNIFARAKHYHSIMLNSKDQIVKLVQRIQGDVPVKLSARLIGMGESTLRAWITSVRVKCSGSFINICRKRHPNQLLRTEAETMKKLLTNDNMLFWPLVSIYYYALKNKLLSISLSTWYKYVPLLGISRLKPRKSKQYGKSITASAPNQYWHADVTRFTTDDGILHYIYLVVDNYSKLILAWAVSTRLSAGIRTDTFRQALQTAVQYHPSTESINLIVDGGSENNNQTVDEFIKGISEIQINKIRALKDVCFSNSHAEAANRTLKCYYLNRQEIAGTASLMKILEKDITDLNEIRPHGQLNCLTPLEAYTGMMTDTQQLSKQKAEARRKRTLLNRYSSCNDCL